MNITVLFWLGLALTILGILIWSDLLDFRTRSIAEIIGKGFTITGACLAGFMLFAKMVLWMISCGG